MEDDDERFEAAAASGRTDDEDSVVPHSIDIPLEVVQKIATYARSPITLMLFGSTCRALREFVSAPELWDRLYKQRWPQEVEFRGLRDHTLSLQDYRDHHIRDMDTVRLILEVSDIVGSENDYALGRVFDNETWKELRRRRPFDLMKLILECKKDVKLFYPAFQITPLVECLVLQSLESFYFIFRLFIVYGESLARNNANVLQVSRSMMTWRDFLTNDAFKDFDSLLSDVATQIKLRIEERSDDQHLSAVEAASLVSNIMFKEMGFSVVDNLHDIQKLLLDTVLATRKGDSVALAIIFATLVHSCLGMECRVLDFPMRGEGGRILVHLVGTETFVDMSDQHIGKVLSLEECREIARIENDQFADEEWNPEQDGVLDASQCLQLYVAKVEKCCRSTMALSSTIGMFNGLMKVFYLQIMLKADGDERATTAMVRQWENDNAFLDPEVFHHYGLIDQPTMERLVDAPFRTVRRR